MRRSGCNLPRRGIPVLQYSSTPLLRLAKIEDKDEDENEAPGARSGIVNFIGLLHQHVPGISFPSG